MHAMCTPSELEKQMRNFTDLIFWQMFYMRHNHTKKCWRYQQLMRSINMKAKNTCGIRTCTSEFCTGNKKRIMRRAKLNRL